MLYAGILDRNTTIMRDTIPDASAVVRPRSRPGA